ncbi:SDR family oxidoreductase [Massilia sp. IC2-477]|uniref:SDR family oxidoreductase n=1 Tax=unclassified Massilia TaxID=2609279 RepID=UPI001D10D5BF|nr:MULTISPECIES: SDR family oxidoreductase [unclassified Massilia]MCC2957360.1 SDR family oxidoreductase [Massilia sp. IC2-477]MCC2973946.1 SDR family oxidoreductase [Massilia sp. IC2-476]
MMRAQFRTIVITGASDGIGAEIARQLAAKEGANIALVLAARNAEQLDAVAGECAAHGAQTLTVPTDVGVQIQCRRLIVSAVEQFGRIDVLVNNAGRSAHALFEEVEDLSWYEELMRVNLWGAVWCTQAALPALKAAQGRIVAVSSLAGLVGVPGRTAYSATKFAMTGFFEALRAEMKGYGVSVTTAYPGVVATRIRYRGFNAQGGELGSSALKEEGAMSVEECARLIIDGMDARKREVVMTAKGKLGRFIKLIAPGLVEKMALAALKQDVRPH